MLRDAKDNLLAAQFNLIRNIEECRFPGGLAASGGKSAFGYTRFTRDYLVAMSDIMEVLPSTAREGFSQIPQHQGVKIDRLTEEEANRFPHEVAVNTFGGIVVPKVVMDDRRYWAAQWRVPTLKNGGFIVYNASDAIRYIVELGIFCRLYGLDILDDNYLHYPTGEIRNVKQACLLLLDWMVSKMHESEANGPGLYEVQTYNQAQTSWSGVMRDGFDAYYHPMGSYSISVNRKRPIAYIENQGLAVDAFRYALELFSDAPEAAEWRRLAEVLPQRTRNLFWMDDEKYFAAALDRDDNGSIRQVKLLSSAAMELLATSFFDNFPDRTELIQYVVSKIYDPGFLTPIGVRTLHLKHARFEGEYYAYHGTGTVWGVTQRRIAVGLRNQGFMQLADDIGYQRFVSGLLRSDAPVEFWHVDRESGDVNYMPLPEARLGSPTIAAAEKPAGPQLWTATGALAEIEAHRRHFISMHEDKQTRAITKMCFRSSRGVRTAAHDKHNRRYFVDTDRGFTLKLQRAEKIHNLQLSLLKPPGRDIP